MPAKPINRVQVVGFGGGWKAQLKTTDQTVLEVWPQLQPEPIVLGTIEKTSEGYELVTDGKTFRAKTMLAVAQAAWIAFAKGRGLTRITVNRYPHNPNEVLVEQGNDA